MAHFKNINNARSSSQDNYAQLQRILEFFIYKIIQSKRMSVKFCIMISSTLSLSFI